MAQELNELALGYAVAIISALHMLLLSIGAALGVYANAAQQMMNWHMFYSLSIGGTIVGMIEGAVWGFVVAYIFAWLYNQFV